MSEPEESAKRAQAPHARAERAESEVARLRERIDRLLLLERPAGQLPSAASRAARLKDRARLAAALLVGVYLVALTVALDMVAIPGIARDNPELAGKVASYLFLGVCDTVFVCVAIAAVVWGLSE